MAMNGSLVNTIKKNKDYFVNNKLNIFKDVLIKLKFFFLILEKTLLMLIYILIIKIL